MKTKWRVVWASLVVLWLASMSCRGEVFSVSIDSGDVTMVVGESVQLSATVVATGSASRTVDWSSTNAAVAAVDAGGLVVANAEGVAEVVATSRFERSRSDRVTVTVHGGVQTPAVLSVSIDQGDQELVVGEVVSLSVTVVTVAGASPAVAWASSDPFVASVSEAGVVAALASGATTITATSEFDPDRGASIAVAVGAAGPGVLRPGGSVWHASGAVLSAQTDSFVGAVAIDFVEVHDPGGLVTLPEGASFVGPAFAVAAERSVAADTDHPFVLGLVLPEGIDIDGLAIGILEPAIVQPPTRPPGDGEDGTPRASWALVPAAYHQPSNLLLAPVLALDAGGWEAVIVRAEGYAPVLVVDDEDAEVSAAGIPPTFEGRCGPGFDTAPETCTETDRETAAGMLEDAYEQLTALGFTDTPRLMRGVGWIRISFEEPYTIKVRWAPGPYYIELQPASTAWAGGALHPSSGLLWIAIDTNGVTEAKRDVVRHEYVHATQYGYDPAFEADEWVRSRWVMEGQAVVLERSYDPVIGGNLPLRAVDISLEDAKWDGSNWLPGAAVEYEAQDFWFYLARRFGFTDASFLEPFMAQGLRAAEVDQVLRARLPAAFGAAGLDGGLPLAYWEWAKNQVFTKQVDMDHPIYGTTCSFTPDSATPTEITYLVGEPPVTRSTTLAPLSSHVYRLDLQAPPGSESLVSISVASASSAVRSAIFEVEPADPTGCFDQADRSDLRVVVTAAGATYLVVVSNRGHDGDTDHTIQATSSHDPTLPLAVEIRDVPEPHCSGRPIVLEAVVTGAGDPPMLPPEGISWWIGASPEAIIGNPIEVRFDAEGSVPVRVRVTDVHGREAEDVAELQLRHCTIAHDDTAWLLPTGSTVVVDVLANDVSLDGGPLRISDVTAPTRGRAEVVFVHDVGREAVRYTGSAPATFTYRVEAAAGGASEATVSIRGSAGAASVEALLDWPGPRMACDLIADWMWPDACCINGRGDVALSVLSDFEHWRAHLARGDGTLLDLGTLGGAWSRSYGLNDRGWVVGQSSAGAGTERAFVWTPEGGMRDLGTLGGLDSTAMAVSDAGHVVGAAARADGSRGAVVWLHDGVVVDIGAAIRGETSIATGVIDSVRWGPIVAGTASAARRTRAFVWFDANGDRSAQAAEFTWLGDLGGGSSSASGVNATLEVIGQSQSSSGEARGFLWSDGAMASLEASTAQATEVSGINRHGHVVGWFTVDAGAPKGAAWSDGRVLEVSTLPGPLPVEWLVRRLRDVNDGGQLLAEGRDAEGCVLPLRIALGEER